MYTNRLLFTLLPLVFTAGCLAEVPDSALEDTQDLEETQAPDGPQEIGELVLENGNLLVFVDQDPSEAVDVAMMEFPARPGPGVIEQMTAVGATPAELWLSVSSKPLLAELERAHTSERARPPEAFSLAPQLREAPEGTKFRGSDFEAWGGASGYCSNNFASDFDTFSGGATISLEDGVGFGDTVYYSYVEEATDIWMGVCNNEPFDSRSGPFSQFDLYRDLSSTWVPFNCPNGLNQCRHITKQGAKAMHYWTGGGTNTFKAAAEWEAGVYHPVMLRVRAENTNGVVEQEDPLCDPLAEDPVPNEPACQSYCVAVFEYCNGWIGTIDEPYTNMDDCVDYCNCNWKPGVYSESEDTTNCRMYAYGEYGTCDAFDRDNMYCYE